MAENLNINQKIDIIVERGPYKGAYLSKVAEINDDIYQVTAPFFNGEIVPLHINQIIKISYCSDNASYQFTAKILDRKREPVALFTVEKKSEAIRIQRRNFFRLNVKLKVNYRVLDSEDNFEDSELKETTTIDISAGGIKMAVDDDFPGEGVLELYLDIPEIKNTSIFGKIVNNYDLPDGRAIGIEFIGIEQKDQDKIVSWLFDFQRDLRKKGLL